jgi:3-oxoacyl-(acyl-carrier-protein) synthase
MSTPIVVTGMGVVSPLGADVETMWQRLIAGQSGVRRLADIGLTSTARSGQRRLRRQAASFSYLYAVLMRIWRQATVFPG